MALRATGPGLIEINPRYRGAGNLKALLYNFDFDDAVVNDLKPEHADFLRSRAVPLLVGNRGKIWLEGRASQIGTNDYNLRLSRRRVQRVVDFLTRNGVLTGQIQPFAVGEDESTSLLADDQRDRAVDFVILPRAQRDPPPPPRTPPPPAVTTRFRLRMLANLSAAKLAPRPPRRRLGAGVTVECSFFEIQDTEHQLAAFYAFGGAGLGVGVANLPWLSGTDAGPWNSFTTSAPMNVGDFGGFTRFTTAGAGSWTINYLNMLGTPDGVDSVYIRINTGTTYGAAMSSTAGDLERIAGPMPARAGASGSW
jgi:hypothetical protein